MEKKTCRKCGLTIRQFVLMNGRGRKRTAWCALIKGVWTEACPTSWLFDKPHKVERK